MENTLPQQEPDRTFDRIFHPRAVGVIGVSTKGNGFGSGILDSLAAIGFSGSLYGVNPRGGEYKGRKLYRSISEIPDTIDFANPAFAPTGAGGREGWAGTAARARTRSSGVRACMAALCTARRIRVTRTGRGRGAPRP